MSIDQPAIPEAIFEKEFQAAIPRYLSKPGVDVGLKMRNKDTDEAMSFAEAFPDTFTTWQTVQSLPDRRGIMYAALDGFMGNDLQLWQIVERFIDDRYPQRALEAATTHAEASDISNSNYWTAVAKTNLVLTNYNQAEANALKALTLDMSNDRAKMALADVYHALGKMEDAHAFYNEILQDRLPKTNAISLTFAQLVGFEGNILPSPFYALDWLQNHPDTTTDTWNWANDEFYYSPHFRAQFAYYLIQQKETVKGLVKLFTLAKEMPWFKEAVINSWHLINQLGMAGNMPNDNRWLEETMKANRWDPHDTGLQRIAL